VRYVHLPGSAVDTALLEDATRRGMWIHHFFRKNSTNREYLQKLRSRRLRRSDVAVEASRKD
jgi:hypothetical protein